MKQPQLEYRLYGFVPYNISPIQQGIQFGHAVVEYGLAYGNSDEYQTWAVYDKTFIILNGGTTNSATVNPANRVAPFQGSLNNLVFELNQMNIPVACFEEPDLESALTAVVFLVNERVFNYDKYPDQRYEVKPGYDSVKNQEMQMRANLQIMSGQEAQLRELLRYKKLA